jgi:hypothetical protein
VNDEASKVLRAPFPPEQVGKLPKGGFQLDYVGHADVTDRLLTVDPEWTWEPLGLTAEGLPALDRFGNLWIRLTVCGTTRIGVGDGKSAKELISDALRNAAMRFGVALDLWAKGDRSFGIEGHDAPVRHQIVGGDNDGQAREPDPVDPKRVERSRGRTEDEWQSPDLRSQVVAATIGKFADRQEFEIAFRSAVGASFDTADDDSLRRFLAHLEVAA